MAQQPSTLWLVHPIPWRVVFAMLLVVVAFLSFKPNPAIQGTPGIPASLAEWFDLFDQWKNFLGFAALGFAGFMAWPDGAGRGSPRRRRVWLALAICGVIVCLELIQIPIPRRWCDPKDVVAGSLGVWSAWPLAGAFRTILTHAGARGQRGSTNQTAE